MIIGVTSSNFLSISNGSLQTQLVHVVGLAQSQPSRQSSRALRVMSAAPRALLQWTATLSRYHAHLMHCMLAHTAAAEIVCFLTYHGSTGAGRQTMVQCRCRKHWLPAASGSGWLQRLWRLHLVHAASQLSRSSGSCTPGSSSRRKPNCIMAGRHD